MARSMSILVGDKRSASVQHDEPYLVGQLFLGPPDRGIRVQFNGKVVLEPRQLKPQPIARLPRRRSPPRGTATR